jgi:hypothetical protein
MYHKYEIIVREVQRDIFHEGQFGKFTTNRFFIRKEGQVDFFTSLSPAEAVALHEALGVYVAQGGQ